MLESAYICLARCCGCGGFSVLASSASLFDIAHMEKGITGLMRMNLRWPRTVLSLLVCMAALIAGPRSAVAAPTLITFKSTLYPYSIGYLHGWHHQVIPFGASKADFFLRPISVGGFTDNMNVYSTTLPAKMSDAALLSANVAQLRQSLKVNPTVFGSITVAGHRLRMIGYFLAVGGRRVNTTQVLLALGGRGWFFTLTVGPGDEIQLRPLFVAVVESFRPRAATP